MPTGEVNVIRSIAAVTTRPPEWRIAAIPAASSQSFITTPPCTNPAELASPIPIQRARYERDCSGAFASTAGAYAPGGARPMPLWRLARSPPPLPRPYGCTVASELERLERRVVRCRRCPRLVAWRQQAAADPPRRYAGERYWARPVPGFGDPAARVVVVGLAPAAHGGNRTGRIFTGDRSGDWLYAALHRAGLASQPTSSHRDDGLELTGAFVTAVNRCAPPGNRPTPAERENCLPYLVEELSLLPGARAILALGSYAWSGALLALAALGHPVPRPRPRFGHGAEARMGAYLLVGSFHPSQQNTFTGKLTGAMLDAVIERAARWADG
jgi:uracil-DNA glycosylase